MRHHHLVLLSFVAVVCHAEVAASPAITPPPTLGAPTLAASIQATQHRMHVRYRAAQALTEAIARSDLDGAHASATVLAELDEPEALPAWRPYLTSIQTSARQVVGASNLATAARLAATLALGCASCHVAVRARVGLAAEPRPADAPALARQMRDHQWAANQLWQGLIAPADSRWRAGAAALSTARLGLVAQHGISGFSDDVDDDARVRLFARRALAAQDLAVRAVLYGDLLATCAHCHAILRDR